jgi:LacI family transcriptional regulator
MPRKKDEELRSRRAPTIQDVAKRAGVSLTAVSFVLNEKGQGKKHISEATRTKVLQAIQELDYHPHMMARILGKGQSNEIISVYDATFSDATLTPFAMELFHLSQQQALACGFTLVSYSLQGMSEEQRHTLYRTIFARRPFGLVIDLPTFTAQDVALARQMGIAHLLFVGSHSLEGEGVHSLVLPDQDIGALAAHHLLSCSYRHLAIIQPDAHIQAQVFAQRLAGMQATLVAHPEVRLDILPLHLSAPSALTLVDTLFSRVDPPTGIYAFNDEYALFLLGALARRGIQVPEEVGLVGTNNLLVGEACWPALTTIRFDAVELGTRMIDFFHLLQQGLPLPEELIRPLAPSLILRDSTRML